MNHFSPNLPNPSFKIKISKITSCLPTQNQPFTNLCSSKPLKARPKPKKTIETELLDPVAKILSKYLSEENIFKIQKRFRRKAIKRNVIDRQRTRQRKSKTLWMNDGIVSKTCINFSQSPLKKGLNEDLKDTNMNVLGSKVVSVLK